MAGGVGSGYFAAPRPRVLGHRGAAAEAPENTLVSFAAALAHGVDILELDVHATADGVVVVIHDATVDRTTDGEGPVSAYAWRHLRRLDAGYRFTLDGEHYPFRGQGIRVPALAEVFEAFPAARFNIEVKQSDPPVAEQVVRVVEGCGALDRVLLAAEREDVMREIRRCARGRVATGYCAAEVADFAARAASGAWTDYRPPGVALQVPPRYEELELITPVHVAAAHALGIEVHAWTINEAAEMQRLLALGVDGIVTDFPGRARAVVDAFRRGRREGT